VSTAAPAPLFHAQIQQNQRYFARLYSYVTGETLPISIAHEQSPSKNNDAEEEELSPHSVSSQHAAAFSTAGGADGAAGARSIEGKILSLHSLLASFDACLTHLESRFASSFTAEIEARRKPGHLWRKWHLYFGGVVAIGVGTALAIKHRPKVITLAGDTWKALREFLHEHAAEPLSNIVQSVTSTFKDRSLFSTTIDALRKSKEDLAAMLRTFALHHAKELSAHEGVSVAEYTASIPERAAQGDMSLVMQTYQREIQRPILSLVAGDLMRGLLVQVQKVKIDTEAAMLAADQVLKSNEINFNVRETRTLAMAAVQLARGVASVGLLIYVFYFLRACAGR
jgi:hypothetical protein